MPDNINMAIEEFRASNKNQNIANIHPDQAEQVFPIAMELVRVWFGYDEGHNNCAECHHGVERHMVKFVFPADAPENKFEWIGCTECSEGDLTIVRACFGEQR